MLTIRLTLMRVISKVSVPILPGARLSEILKASLLLVSAISVLACSAMKPTTPSACITRNSPVIRIGTYNVFTGTHNVPQTVRVIQQMNADVLTLQELSPEGSKLLDRALKRDYPYRYFFEGVAILSRFKLSHPRYEHSHRGINGFLFAEITSPGGRMQIASLHLDPLRVWTPREKWSLPLQLLWGQAGIHRAEVEQIIGALQPGLPTILAGDFNSASHAAIKRMQMLGYTDTFAEVTPHPDRISTLHFELLGFHAGRRIDFILRDRSFKTIESQVLPGAPSDHDSVVSVLCWNREP